MTAQPTISVVMSVYNGEALLQESIESILSQKKCDFEFIIIDDGSIDATSSILDVNASRDRRIRVFKQENQGLTRALVRGCAEAKGEFIARQDCGDVSLPGRLGKQVGYLVNNPAVVVVSCGTRYLGPDMEFLYEKVQSDAELARGVRNDEPDKLRGPSHHGSTMFRRKAYEKVGGYRYQFRVAQDLDLWTRLSDFGNFSSLPEILYEAVLAPGSLSSMMRDKQVELTGIIAKCVRRRSAGINEVDLLHLAMELSSTNDQSETRKTEEDFYYFIAGCLRSHNASLVKKYYRKVLENNCFNIKALLHYCYLIVTK